LIVVCAANITTTAVAVAVAIAAVVVLSLSTLVVRLVCRTTLMRWRWGAGGEKNTKKYLEKFRKWCQRKSAKTKII
jgi:hypothetical protein